MQPDPAEWFRSRSVETENGCWEWQYYRTSKGYGVTKMGKWRTVYAHKRAYLECIGPIPEGMTVDHECFNHACVNPAHLGLLTFDENRRKQAKMFAPTCINGHPWSAENTYRKPAGAARQCKACNRAAVARYKARKSNALVRDGKPGRPS